MIKYLTFATALCMLMACNTETEKPTDEITDSGNIPAVYQKVYGATDMYIDGNELVITCNGLPDHGSPYYAGTMWADSLYEPYNGSNPNWVQNPNVIAAQNLTFRIPLNPTEDPVHAPTPLGPIGVALNGVPFFNQYAAGGAALTDVEINSFDQYYGHPTPMMTYHYHWEPLYLTNNEGSDALLGFLLDGFPVYGPVENGVDVQESDLDAYHGHIRATADYPEGIYHYHVTALDPYINGAGFYGVPGSVTF